ncbi:MAG: guanylate kinase [Acidobacteria bacterium]|nr:guanylate kinase [Acidobacteriota bacterium]
MSSSGVNSSPRASLFVLAAPSGTGKTTLIQRAFSGEWPDGGPPEFSVSHTTRDPRPGEVEGEHYYFVDEAEFQGMIAAGEFLEWAQVHGQLKGTSGNEVEGRLEAGVDVLLDIDVQGVESVLAVRPDACSILIVPPSFDELKRRILDRGHDSSGAVTRRLSVSLCEIERYALFDYVIVNDDAERAGRQLIAIIVAWRSRLARRLHRIEMILEDFHRALEPGERR